MIPRTLFELRDADLLRIPIFCQISIRRGLDDKLFIPIKRIIEDCGYQPNRNGGRINDRVINTIRSLEQYGYISTLGCPDFKLSSTLEISANRALFDVPTSFCIITLEEFYKITHYRSDLDFISSKLMPEYLLYILVYIRLNKSRRSAYQERSPENRPEVFYQQQKNISKTLGISQKTLQRGIDILEKLNIIVSSPLPRYKDCYGHWHTDITVFVDKYDGWELELQWGIDYLKNSKETMYVHSSTDNGGDDMV